MWKAVTRSRRRRAVEVLIAVCLSVMSACWRSESPAPETDMPPASSESPSRPPAERPEERAPAPPIPPLEGAERPAQSPLEELSGQTLDPQLEAPVLELPSLEPDAAPEARPALDLPGLSRRLRETDALGVFTKVALKNQIDDLTEELRRFHKKGRGRLPSLRERYDGLVLKIMALVQDEEPRLATDLARSREGIWALLADPDGFAELVGGTS